MCADVTLSRLDGDLATAWKQALQASDDANSMKAEQRDWLKQRDRCAGDRGCLTDRYQQRLNTLRQASAHAAQPWQQSWSLDLNSSTSGATLVFTGTMPNLHFSLGANAGGHDGGMDGDIAVHGDHGSFRQGSCQLDFSRRGGRIEVVQKGGDSDCGAGMGVFYGGSYIPTAQFNAKPKPDLLNLRVLASAQQNDAARQLLGSDYQVLVNTVNLWDRDSDKDGLGATVASGFVRGLANTNAFMLMSKEQQLWVGLLVFDANNQLRMRYYSNVPAWKQRIPKTIQDWHDGIDKALPIDLMP